MSINFEALQNRHYPEFLKEEYYQEIFKKAQVEMMRLYPNLEEILHEPDTSVMKHFVKEGFDTLVLLECHKKIKEITPVDEWPFELLCYPVAVSDITPAESKYLSHWIESFTTPSDKFERPST